MKLKSFFLLIVTIFSIVISCTQQKSKTVFTLKGKINGNAPNKIYLYYGNIIDSSIVKNNIFYFTGKIDFPIEAKFSIVPASSIEKSFYLESTNMNIEVTVKKEIYKGIEVSFIKIDTLIGTKTAHLQTDFEKFKIENKSKSNWNSKLFKKLHEIITLNPKHRYSGNLLAEISKLSILNKSQLNILYKKLDTTRQASYSKEVIKRSLFPNNNVQVGKNIFDFDLPNKNNLIINTKKYRGSILLINFWASWCRPCRKENPELSKIYKDFKNKNFEILGVSIDTNKDKWLNAIEKDNLSWENVIEMKGYQSDILAKYDVISSIPHNFLINENGKIIAKDISMNELRELLIKPKKKPLDI